MFDLLERHSRLMECEEDASDHEEMVVPEAEDEALEVEQEPQQEYEWSLEQTFPDQNSCDDFIKQEGCWTKVRDINTVKGVKTTFRCNKTRSRGPQCVAGIYTKHSITPMDSNYYLFRKSAAHNHDTLNNNPKAIPDVVVLIHHIHRGMRLRVIQTR